MNKSWKKEDEYSWLRNLKNPQQGTTATIWRTFDWHRLEACYMENLKRLCEEWAGLALQKLPKP